MLSTIRADIASYREKQGHNFILNSNFWVLMLHRFGHWVYHDCPRPLRFFLKIAYRPMYLFAETFLQMALPASTKIGPGLFLPHPGGVRISPHAIIGAYCEIGHNVTIGEGGNTLGAARVGERVRIGAGASLVGPLTIGSDARIASLALVVSDVPPGMTMVGNPARPIPAKEMSPLAASKSR